MVIQIQPPHEWSKRCGLNIHYVPLPLPRTILPQLPIPLSYIFCYTTSATTLPLPPVYLYRQPPLTEPYIYYHPSNLPLLLSYSNCQSPYEYYLPTLSSILHILLPYLYNYSTYTTRLLLPPTYSSRTLHVLPSYQLPYCQCYLYYLPTRSSTLHLLLPYHYHNPFSTTPLPLLPTCLYVYYQPTSTTNLPLLPYFLYYHLIATTSFLLVWQKQSFRGQNHSWVWLLYWQIVFLQTGGGGTGGLIAPMIRHHNTCNVVEWTVIWTENKEHKLLSCHDDQSKPLISWNMPMLWRIRSRGITDAKSIISQWWFSFYKHNILWPLIIGLFKPLNGESEWEGGWGREGMGGIRRWRAPRNVHNTLPYANDNVVEFCSYLSRKLTCKTNCIDAQCISQTVTPQTRLLNWRVPGNWG